MSGRHLAGEGPPSSPAGPVRVRLLGPVSVEGAARPFARRRALELVAYLAVHPAGATTGQWSTALWPDRAPASATLHAVASAARCALGPGPDGDHLPRAHGRLALAGSVSTDWAVLRAHGASSDPGAWRAALAMVRGEPLTGLADAEWPVLSGVVAGIEEDVVVLGVRAGEHALARGDAAGACRVVRQALLASPYEERLFRVLLRAADLTGSRRQLNATMAELVGRLGAPRAARLARGPLDDEALALVHPSTAEMYRELVAG